jgi:hypothetical protein
VEFRERGLLRGEKESRVCPQSKKARKVISAIKTAQAAPILSLPQPTGSVGL